MKTFLSRVWLPAAVVTMVTAQMFSVETPQRAFTAVPSYQRQPQDTIIYKNRFASAKTDESMLVLESVDTLPSITARDTIKVPDSLRNIDPFRYKYYVALMDSLTHTIVRDSLKAAGDSLDWPKLDSLYKVDSIALAKLKHEQWYASLDPAERKKYDFEQKMNRKLHESDSALAVRKAKKERRDSILQDTPRVLETFALADSLHYKRILQWTHDRDFHQMKMQPLDTTFNTRFYDYPFLKNDVGATWLGTAGSPLQTYNFFNREYTEDVAFYQPYESWSHSPSTLPFYNTKTPYTELAYWGTLFATKEKESDNLHLLTSQNITPALNYTLSYDRFGGGGMLVNEATINKNVVASFNYLGKKYLMHGGYIYNMVSQKENGGIVDEYWIRDTTVDAREIKVNLASASSYLKKNTVFLDQQYRIPFNFINNIKAKRDSTFVPDDNVTTAFIGHSSEFTTYRKNYKDNENQATSRYYDNFFLSPNSTNDSLRVMKLDNKVFIRLQPWADDAIVSKLNVGVGNRIMSWFDFDPEKAGQKNNTVWNSSYIYAGAEGHLKKYISWDANGGYTFLGDQMNDLYLKGNLAFNFFPFRRAKNSPITIEGHFETTLKEPDHYQQRLMSNHYQWSNSFDKISVTKMHGAVSVPRWKFHITGGYALLDKNIYYTELGEIKQNTTPMSVFNIALTKNFTLFNALHFDNRVLLQKSSNESVLPLPVVAANGRYYFQINQVGPVPGAMVAQLGVEVYYNTGWYANAWNPALGAFVNQTKQKYGNCPYFDVFANFQWKRASIFIKYQNAGMGWPMDSADYFTAAGHINTQRILKFGVHWPFYTQSEGGHSHGSSSSSSGGNSSSSGQMRANRR